MWMQKPIACLCQPLGGIVDTASGECALLKLESCVLCWCGVPTTTHNRRSLTMLTVVGSWMRLLTKAHPQHWHISKRSLSQRKNGCAMPTFGTNGSNDGITSAEQRSNEGCTRSIRKLYARCTWVLRCNTQITVSGNFWATHQATQAASIETKWGYNMRKSSIATDASRQPANGSTTMSNGSV